ncbi:hypothetical protein [Peribacillus sp. SCS-37]|uniref:hypothetical protein n=1 Tax=Paraperibacillus esterisolvens TaxID=3115296 RepID=UPI00390673C2
MTQLQALFLKILKSTREILTEIRPYDHPLLTLLRASLQEQEKVLNMLIPSLADKQEIELDTIKEYISIVYHNHEISFPIFRSWKRAGTWMNLFSQTTADQLEPKFPEMKKILEAIARELKEIYGLEDIKYVVPAFYLPAYQREEF